MTASRRRTSTGTGRLESTVPDCRHESGAWPAEHGSAGPDERGGAPGRAAAGGLPVLERVAASILERGLAHLEGGTLDVTLPDGTMRRFGSGPAVEMTIHDSRLFRRIATRGAIGLGESYMAEEWDAHDLVGALRAPAPERAQPREARHPTLRRVLDAPPRPNRRNGLLRARRNIAYHYDLGNELFELMLDPTMTYSCAIFEDEDEPLEDAQRRKLRRICDKLELGPDDRVLEIGCGWGGFAMLAAEEYGATSPG